LFIKGLLFNSCKYKNKIHNFKSCWHTVVKHIWYLCNKSEDSLCCFCHKTHL